jgi:hypothetical protein
MGARQVTVRAATTADVGAIARLYLEVAEEVIAREPSFRHLPKATDVMDRYPSGIGDEDRRAT